MADRARPVAYERLTPEHPALALLADTLRATRGPAAPEVIAKLLGHALTATGYRVVPAESTDDMIDRGWRALNAALVEFTVGDREIDGEAWGRDAFAAGLRAALEVPDGH